VSYYTLTMSKESAIILVMNGQGQHALQLRAAGDSSYPSHWDFSAAGGIEPGEPPLAAAARELYEEIGVTGVPIFLQTILYEDEQGADLLHIFKFQYTGDFKPDPVEVELVKFFSVTEIAQLITAKAKFHPEFIFLWNQGFFS
jgi:isopentenyl-diphosphate delta-isomerase